MYATKIESKLQQNINSCYLLVSKYVPVFFYKNQSVGVFEIHKNILSVVI